MNTDGKPHHVENKDEPAVGARFISHILPFQDGPENQGRKERGGTVNFAFHCTVPERIAESIGQGANSAGGDNGKDLALAKGKICFLNNFTCEMGYGPEKKKDGQAAQECTHEIHGPGCREGIIAKKNDKKAAHHHEKRGSGRVRDLQFVSTGYEFAAIPETA